MILINLKNKKQNNKRNIIEYSSEILIKIKLIIICIKNMQKQLIKITLKIINLKINLIIIAKIEIITILIRKIK